MTYPFALTIVADDIHKGQTHMSFSHSKILTFHLFRQTFRVSLLQASQVFTSYVTDQLQFETKLEKELEEGKISSLELEIKNNEWEEVEWNKRIKTIPDKIKTALLRYHALILIMRSYEFVFERIVSREMMDKLTKDTFKTSVHKSREIKNGERPSEGYRKEMFETCIYSNFISFLSDYTIQQAVLTFGYYAYFKNARNRKKLKDSDELSLNLNYKVSKADDDLFEDPTKENITDEAEKELKEAPTEETEDEGDANDEDKLAKIDNTGTLAFTYIYKSFHLMASRAIGLYLAGLGGAFGSILRPGWGTLVGVQLGDACATALLDE